MQAGPQSGSMTLVSSTGAPLLVVPLTGTAAPVPPIVAFAPAVRKLHVRHCNSRPNSYLSLGGYIKRAVFGGIALSCSGAPSYSTCTVSPTSAILASNSQTNITVTVTTELQLSSSARPVNRPFSLAGAGSHRSSRRSSYSSAAKNSPQPSCLQSPFSWPDCYSLVYSPAVAADPPADLPDPLLRRRHPEPTPCSSRQPLEAVPP